MRERRACSAERKQLIGLLGRTEPSPSGQDGPPSKPNRACKPPSRARAEGLLGLLSLITGLPAAHASLAPDWLRSGRGPQPLGCRAVLPLPAHALLASDWL